MAPEFFHDFSLVGADQLQLRNLTAEQEGEVLRNAMQKARNLGQESGCSRCEVQGQIWP